MVSAYFPDRGEIVYVQFSPQAGKEQSGNRPALILTPSLYTKRSGIAWACPITHKRKGYPFEVLLPPDLSTQGVVLVDHGKSIDWEIRGGRFIEKVPEETLDEVMEKIEALLHGE